MRPHFYCKAYNNNHIGQNSKLETKMLPLCWWYFSTYLEYLKRKNTSNIWALQSLFSQKNWLQTWSPRLKTWWCCHKLFILKSKVKSCSRCRVQHRVSNYFRGGTVTINASIIIINVAYVQRFFTKPNAVDCIIKLFKAKRINKV